MIFDTQFESFTLIFQYRTNNNMRINTFYTPYLLTQTLISILIERLYSVKHLQKINNTQRYGYPKTFRALK